MTNTADTAREQFEIVRRGYEPQQVDRRISTLARELQAARQRTAELERRVEELHLQGDEPTRPDAPAFAGVGARIEQILALADDEAKELRGRAVAETEQHRALSEQAAEKVRAEAERYAQERRSEADAEAARVLEDARRQSDQLRDSTERDAKTRREEAEALFESNRAKAAQAAADFETTLAHRRDQAEHDYTEQLKANEQQLSAVSHRAEQLRLEAEKLRADADRKSKRTLDEAQRQADEIIAEAKASAERIRGESQRELSAATQRRDSINSQLTNVRQMLATLTGASLPNPFGADEGDATPAAKPAAQAGGPAADEAGAPAAPGSNVAPTGTAKAEGKSADGQQTEGKPSDAKAAEAKPGEAKPGETKPGEAKPGGPAQGDARATAAAETKAKGGPGPAKG
jgi:cell division septum initiation protein DivIVA